MQAIGVGARAIFEHYIDLKWLQTFPDELWFERFRVFATVDQYQSAKKTFDHAQNNQGRSLIDATQSENFMKRLDRAQPMCEVVGELWGRGKKGQPKWPEHWTGMSLRERTQAIDAKVGNLYCEDMRVQMYPILSAFVHAGPGPEHLDEVEREKHVAFAYCNAFLHAANATEVICDLLAIREHIVGFDQKMRELTEWHKQALQTLPSAF